MKPKFFICKHCGNIISIIKNSGVPIMCCGEKMIELIPGATDGAIEKHVPVYEFKNNQIIVTIGSVNHPMEEKHFIEWIVLQTKSGNQIKYLIPNQNPKVCFTISDGDEVEAIYAYCNIHGLWKVEL